MKPETSLKIKEEVKKQFDAGFLAVTRYPEWVANIVPVPKKDGKVLEFYANAWPTEEGVRDMRSWVRGQWIPFDAYALSQFLGDPLVLEEG